MVAYPAAAVAADLVHRNFARAAHAPDAVWCGDISYVRTHEAGPTILLGLPA